MSALVLASGSRTRARLLRAAGLAFEVQPANVDEETVKDSFFAEGPDRLADALAELKACKISSSRPDAFVIGADQLLVFERDVISKSTTPAEARRLLLRLSGQTHTLISAVALAKGGAVIWRHLARAELCMRRFSEEFLDTYLAENADAVRDCVGCYEIEGAGIQLFSAIEGDYFTILGLPLLPLLGALRELGVVRK